MKQRNLFAKPVSSSPKPDPKKSAPRSESRKKVDANWMFSQPYVEKSKLTNPDDIRVYELIQRRRLQLLVWSRLYYELDASVVPDSTFNEKGRELADLQAKYPEISKMVIYAKEFEDWDGSTGYHLPLRDPWVCSKANQILRIHDRRNEDGKFQG